MQKAVPTNLFRDARKDTFGNPHAFSFEAEKVWKFFSEYGDLLQHGMALSPTLRRSLFLGWEKKKVHFSSLK